MLSSECMPVGGWSCLASPGEGCCTIEYVGGGAAYHSWPAGAKAGLGWEYMGKANVGAGGGGGGGGGGGAVAGAAGP